MRATGILHAELLAVVASLGHGQRLALVDAGMPIAPAARRIDLAVRCGVPSFGEVLAAIAEDLVVEQIFIATESDARSASLRGTIARAFSKTSRLPPIELVPHEQLKALSDSAVAVVRTGECTPYMNAVLVGGVSF